MEIKKVLIICFLITGFSTCKKFPEDKFISLLPVKARLEGTWKFESIIYNGNDITSLYNDSLVPHTLNDEVLKFAYNVESGYRKSSSYYYKQNELSINVPASGSEYRAGLKFVVYEKKISFTNNGHSAGIKRLNRLFLEDSIFEIMTLYNKKLKIKNDTYEINLKKIK